MYIDIQILIIAAKNDKFKVSGFEPYGLHFFPVPKVNFFPSSPFIQYFHHYCHHHNHHHHHIMHQCQHYAHPQGFLKKSWQHFAAHLAAFLTFPLQFAGRMFHVFKVGRHDNRDHGWLQ